MAPNAAPVAAAPAGNARPASQTTVAAPVKSSTGPDLGQGLADALGGVRHEPLVAQAPAVTEQSAETAIAPDLGQAGDQTTTVREEPAVTEVPAETTDGTETTEPLPGDDLLKAFDELRLPDDMLGEKPADASQTEVQLTDEAIDKLANPDGQADLETQYQNLRTVFGRQGTEYGKAKAALKEFQAKEAELTGMLTPFVEFTGYNPETKTFNPKPEFVFKMIESAADRITPQQWDQYLAAAGKKIVPLDYKGEPVDDGSNDLKTVLDELMPGDSMTFDEKVAESESWTGSQKRNLDAKLRKLEVAREFKSRETDAAKRLTEQQAQAKAAQEKQAAQAKAVEEAKATETFLTAMATKFGGAESPAFKRAKSVMRVWNQTIPKGMEIKARHKLLHALAMADRARDDMRAYGDARAKAALEQSNANGNLSAAIPTGEVPTIVSKRNGSPAVNAQARSLAEALS